MKNVCLLPVLLLVSISIIPSLIGANTILTGKVIDGATGETMIGLSLHVDGTMIGTVSDVDGYFTLSIPEGTRQLNLGFYCFGDNSVAWCGQQEGLLVLGPRKASLYNEEGRKSCGLGKRTRRTRSYAKQHFPGIKDYRQEQLGQTVLNASGQQQVLMLSSLLTKSIAEWQGYFDEKVKLVPDTSAHSPFSVLTVDTIPGREISGIILDDQGEPLIGASILFCENRGAVADLDGAFSIFVPAECPTLTVSYTGFTTKEFKVQNLVAGQGTTLDVVLELKTDLIICFGPPTWNADPQKAPSTVVPAQLPLLHYTHPKQLLRGQLPGLIVSQAGNNPWAEPHMRQQGIQIKIQAAGQQRQGERDYDSTFFSAAKYNPTAPVLFEEAPEYPLLRFYFDNSTLFLRNYFETITEVDFFNPVAIQAANRLLEERANRWVMGELRLELADPLQLRVQAGRQANDWVSGEENRTFSFFRGAALSPFPGAAQRRRLEQRQNWIRGTLEYVQDFRDGLLEVQGGYEFQKRDLEDNRALGLGFGNDDFSYENFEFFLVDESQLVQANYNEGTRLISFFSEQDLRWRWLELRTAINYQGGTRLGTNQQWHPYWGSDARLSLNEIFDLSSGTAACFVHAGYGQLGNQPRDRTYARGQFDANQEAFVNSNPDLRPERRRVATGGFGWRNHFGFYGSIDYFASFLVVCR